MKRVSPMVEVYNQTFFAWYIFASDFFGLKNSRSDNQALLINHWVLVFFFLIFIPVAFKI